MYWMIYTRELRKKRCGWLSVIVSQLILIMLTVGRKLRRARRADNRRSMP